MIQISHRISFAHNSICSSEEHLPAGLFCSPAFGSNESCNAGSKQNKTKSLIKKKEIEPIIFRSGYKIKHILKYGNSVDQSC